MFISYYDEAGDDGFPEYASPLFVLTCIYFNHRDWQLLYREIQKFRILLKNEFSFPVNLEFHTRNFILNKKPYGGYLQLSDENRLEITGLFCDAIGRLNLKAINVAINKTKITNQNYEVLDKAFTYSIQRIENDLNKSYRDEKFMIITDPGRVGKMRKTSRKIQKINYIPSKYFTNSFYRQEIQRLIEDPLPKESDQSYFIQICDLISYIVYHKKRYEFGLGNFHNRTPILLTDSLIENWLEKLTPILNVNASRDDPFGIVSYPK